MSTWHYRAGARHPCAMALDRRNDAVYRPGMLGVARRVSAGVVLLLMAAGLWTTGTHGPTPDRQLVALALVVLWGGGGLALIAGLRGARIVGLALAIVGGAVGLVFAIQGVDGPDALLGLFFSPADTARWYVVMPTGWGMVVLSGLAALLLALPFRPPGEVVDQAPASETTEEDPY